MEGLLERIRAARAKVKQLQADRAQMVAAVEASEARAREGGREQEVLKARIKELEQENEVLRTAMASAKGQEREGTKEKIDELVKEIDQCLALLNG
ncbi:MAG: hypothetical protein J5I62_12975 [Flavobacteriales bacterium]|nr:hypothetical protein [Flavobacteriales bacterium]MEB2340647.1 hypothetical protein [Flavobacteriia bacterium]